MSAGWFITGTDTGVGKTLVSELLLEGLRGAGHIGVGMKPVASGCRLSKDGARSEDAERLMAASAAPFPYQAVNPYAFIEPIAPHIAAELAGRTIDIEVIRANFSQLARAGRVVVEGIGGWRVPIDARRTMADVAVALGLPVVLVVGMRLGCLNHALLTAEAIAADGARLIGWVANVITPDLIRQTETMAALTQRLGRAPLAIVPYRPSPATRAMLAPALAGALLSN